MNIISIIPARGGSKGIPNKNIHPIMGKPLLAYTIEQSISTPAIDETYVSTDDEQIARVARAYGAKVIIRPEEISGDTASSESALIHAIDTIKKQNAEAELEKIVFLQATSPIRHKLDIQNAIELFDENEADSLFSSTPLHGFLWRLEEKMPKSFSYDYHNRPRRQDAPIDVVENGSIYIFKPWVLKKYNNRLGGKIINYHMPHIYSFQIDEPDDITIINNILQTTEQNISIAPSLAKVKLFVLDFDGVLTDNKVYVNQDGTESVRCSRGDGMGLERLRTLTDVEVFILSKETNPVVKARSTKLKIPCINACDNKIEELKKIASKKRLTSKQVAYIGNDLNDVECLKWVGVSISVADARNEVKNISKIVTTKKGGEGAVREVCEMIISSKQKNQD